MQGSSTRSKDATVLASHLRCEYRENPLGIDVASPRLSWKLALACANGWGCHQTAYEIQVAGTIVGLLGGHADLWHTGKVRSDETIHIEYGGRPLVCKQPCFWRVRVWDERDRVSTWSEPALWTMGLLEKSDWGARWIEESEPYVTEDDSHFPPAISFRKTFILSAAIRRATAHVTGLGAYQMFINGQRVGAHVLAPEWTDYRTRIQYQTFDVTDLVREGENAVGAWVGMGWYMSRLMLVGRCAYGNTPRFLLRLDVELEDGSVETVVTDDSWRSTHEGPIRLNDIYDGEDYDARLEMPGWDKPGFDDHTWKSVRTEELGSPALVWQPCEPIKVVQELRPVGLSSPSPGVYVFDLGQNMAGWCRVDAVGSAGESIKIRFAEMLNDDGTIYTENLRGARATFNYTPKEDGRVAFEPHFTYFGFRYVEIEGLAVSPSLESVIGRVICSSSPDAGAFECSNEMLTQLSKNVYWSQRANLFGTTTDCPQRDERFGWTGDIQVFAQTAILNMDMGAFFSKFVKDLRDSQSDDGRFPDFAPHPGDKNAGWTGAPGWGDVGTVVPWRQYENYADKRMIEEHFESAKRWVDYIHGMSPDLIWREGRGNNYNDWLNGDSLIMDGWPRDGATVPPDILATAFFAHSTEIVARMAEVIGRRSDADYYAGLFENIKEAFSSSFVQPDGRMESDTQAAYALALNFNLLPHDLRPLAAKHMVEGLAKYNGHMSTGFLSSHRLMLELSRAGYIDEAYRLALLTDFPSWGMMIENGATTIWERWDGYVKGRGFQDAGMNSFNHWAFGAVSEWMWRSIIGLSPDEQQPGFKHFIIHPRPGGGLTWAKGTYESIRGTIRSSWRLSEEKFTLDVMVPPGTSATVYVPTSSLGTVVAEGAEFSHVEADKSVFRVSSGSHEFICPLEA